MIKRFLLEEDGMGTAEVVIIAAVLVGAALIFKKTIHDFIKGISAKYFNSEGDKFNNLYEKDAIENIVNNIFNNTKKVG